MPRYLPDTFTPAEELALGQRLWFRQGASKYLESKVNYARQRLYDADLRGRPLTILEMGETDDGTEIRVRVDLSDGQDPMWFVFGRTQLVPGVGSPAA
jgi:hypothetical protein